MSKEVKLGLAIGGIFLSVILVYVLVVSGDSAKPDQVTLDIPAGPPVETTPSVPTPPPVRENPTPEPRNEVPPTQPPQAEARPENNPPPATQTAVADAGDQVKADQWIRLMAEGMKETTTPAAPAPVGLDVPPTAPGGGREPGPAAIPERQVTPPTGNSSDITAQTGSGSGTSQPPQNTPRTHTVTRGETYSSISAAVYGSSNYFAHIQRANPGVDPAKLKPGMVINLPPIEQVRADRPTREDPSRQIDAKSEYLVQGGDNLSVISIKLYGKPDRVEKLYEVNKNTIGPDKAKLQIGMLLKLPEAPTVAAR